MSIVASATQAARAFSSLGVGAGAELAGTALISRLKVNINEAHDSVARTELIIRPSLSHLNVENGTFAFSCRISLAVGRPMATGLSVPFLFFPGPGVGGLSDHHQRTLRQLNSLCAFVHERARLALLDQGTRRYKLGPDLGRRQSRINSPEEEKCTGHGELLFLRVFLGSSEKFACGEATKIIVGGLSAGRCRPVQGTHCGNKGQSANH